MYKNPLKKRQQDESTSSEKDQQFALAFIKWLSTNVPEFKGAKPQQIIKKFQELSQSEEGQKQIQTWQTQFKQELEGESAQSVFAAGGKLHDFICKHARGGYIQGCGCGSKVPKGENGMPDGINSKSNPSYKKTDIGNAIVEDSDDISRIIWNPRSERPDTMIRTGRNMPGLVSPYDEWYRKYRINAVPEDIAEKSVWDEINARIDKAKEIYNSTQKKQEGGELDRWPGFEMVRDTVISTPGHNPYRERIIANGRGDAARQRIYDNDTTSVGGSFSDGQFMPDGDIMYRHPELDAKMQELINQKRANSTIAKHQAGGGISRREALQSSMDQHGFDRATAQRAYQNAKMGLRNQGLRGRALRQAARQVIMGSNNQPVDTPPADVQPVEVISAAPIRSSAVSITTPKIGIVDNRQKMINYDNMDFNTAFGYARSRALNGGDKTFTWRGKKYGTNLGQRTPSIVTEEPVVDIPDYELIEYADPATDAWIQYVTNDYNYQPEINTDDPVIPKQKRMQYRYRLAPGNAYYDERQDIKEFDRRAPGDYTWGWRWTVNNPGRWDITY